MDKRVINGKRNAAGVVTTAALVTIFAYAFILAPSHTLINEVVAEFSLEGAGQGLMSNLLSVGFMLSLFIIPVMQGRAQKLTLIIAASVLQAVMLAAGGASPTFFLFGTSCVILGFSGGFIDTYCNSAVVDVRKTESSRYLGYMHGLFGVGSLIAPFLFIWLLRSMQWRGIFYILAGISAATALFVAIAARGKAGKDSAPTISEHLFKKTDLMDYLRKKRNLALVLACFFSTVAQGGVMAWIVRYMTLRFDAADLGALSFSIFWVCATVNRFGFAQFVKNAPMKFFALGSVLHCVLLTVGVYSASPVVLCVMIGALGLIGGHFFPVLISEFAKGYEGRTSFTTSVMMFIASISRIVAPVLIAYTSSSISLTFGILIPAAAALLAAVSGWLASQTNASHT